MKNSIIILFVLQLLIACNCKKTAVIKVSKAKDLDSKTMVDPKAIDCPIDGICTSKILKDKKMVLKTDDFGRLYYETEQSELSSVVVYEYKKNNPSGYQDGNYREEIIFEIKNSDSKLSFKDEALDQSKMLFGRHCYCKGQAGYFAVKKGKFSFERKNQIIHFELDFTITEVPQIITNIRAEIK